MSGRVLVTGGSGFVGRRCIPLLIARGYSVVALVRSDEAASVVAALGAQPEFGDLDDPASLVRAFEAASADALINIASLGFGQAPAIVAACIEAGLRRTIFVSTTAIFTRLNAVSKVARVAAERMIEESGLDYTIVRPTMIYGGADDRNLVRLLSLTRLSRVIPLPGGGRRMQQPVHVEDVAAALVSCLERPSSVGRAIDIAGPHALMFKEIVRRIAAANGRRVLMLPVPLGPLIAATRVYERRAARPRLKAEQFERLAEDKVFDIGSAVELLGYSPRTFEMGIGQEAAELREAAEAAGVRAGFGRYWRTIRYLRARQVGARLRLKAQRRIAAQFPRLCESVWGRRMRPVSSAGWPVDFQPLDQGRFSDVSEGERILGGCIRLLEREAFIAKPDDWVHGDASQLWRFHAHYFDWAWHLDALGGRGRQAFMNLWETWRAASPYGRGDAWAPYVVALRLWTLCGLYSGVVSDEARRSVIEADIRRHAGYLRANVEFDVGGNHLIKDLKALIGAAAFLNDASLREWSLEHLRAELADQVLADGGHFELSPSYHAQVLGDLIDLESLLSTAGFEAASTELASVIESMRCWLAQFVGPDGTTPVLNDGFALDRPELDRLGVRTDRPAQPLVHLRESGYLVVRPRPDLLVIVDVGWPCPASLPAHAQADCLSFVVCRDDGWLVVDSGCSVYGNTPRRGFERSTMAHNTVEVDGASQTEVWGSFRAGRRARATVVGVEQVDSRVRIEATHDGYRSLPGAPVHRRVFEISPTAIEITDEVAGGGHHTASSRIHVNGRSLRRTSSSLAVSSEQHLSVSADGSPVSVERATFSRRFGVLEESTVCVQRNCGPLPISFRWRLEL